jgi:alginate O-acetyltransferase complex protein AlgI
MLFSSAIFLFYFLPFLLLAYFCIPNLKFKNHVLLLFSIVFFAWGGVFFTLILFLSIVFNFLTGNLIERYHSKLSLGIAVGGNILVLVIFKYANFIIENLNLLLTTFQISPIDSPGILLPIGISFYTFHSISYNVDVYRQKSSAQKNIFNMALYIILFTQLVAGPIIRYNVFAPQLFGRVHNFEKFISGIERFIIGLGKKVLIANTLARLADDAFAQNISNMDLLFSWFGILCYTFQIYFDFSGYSDMAIGLSRLFGFEFPENFNKPYTATSIKDFWRRWHISLSTFFRDYLYIPLGGNQKGKLRTYLNLLIVFFLTGLWHGANYTFIVWGLIHGSFLLLERTKFGIYLERIPIFFRGLYSFFIVLIAWIPFRANSLDYALAYCKSLFIPSGKANPDLVSSYFTTDLLLAFLLAIIISFNLPGYFASSIKSCSLRLKTGADLSKALFLLLILFFSAVYLMSGTYNPFIYYQF